MKHPKLDARQNLLFLGLMRPSFLMVLPQPNSRVSFLSASWVESGSRALAPGDKKKRDAGNKVGFLFFFIITLSPQQKH